MEYLPPKYVTIVNTLQARIENGTYPPGAILPSETALMAEFDVSRPTAVRALEILRQEGWIVAERGKGRFVRGKPADARPIPPYALALMSEEVDGAVRIVDVTEGPAPTRAAGALGVRTGLPVVVRRRLVGVDGLGPVELGTAYIPVDLADGTAVRSADPLPEGLLRHLSDRKGVRFQGATERISARPATADEARLLEISPSDWVLTALFTITDRDGTPVLALDVAVPPSRHEFEDSFVFTQ